MEAADIAEAADGWWLCQLEMQHPGVAIVDVEQQGNNLLDLAGHAMHQGSAEPLMHWSPAHLLALASFLSCPGEPMPAGD